MRTLVRVFAVLSVGAMAVVPMSPARASATRIPFDCDAYQTGLSFDDAREWEAGTTFQGRNAIETIEYVGDEYCDGIEIVVGNGILNPVTPWEDPVWGTFRYELHGIDGGFEGTWSVKYGLVLAEVGMGYGELEGWQFRSVWEPNPDWDGTPSGLYGRLSGYVFDPGG